MSMRYTHDLVATVGRYTDATGQEKNRYLNVGKVFKRDDGSAAFKIDQLPVGNEWNGWLNIYPRKDQQPPSQTSQRRNEANTAMQAPSASESDPFDDDIPF